MVVIASKILLADPGHYELIRALVVDGAAAGSFDRQLAGDCMETTVFFANLRRALQSGYFVQMDPLRQLMLRQRVVGFVYTPPGSSAPVGFGLLKTFVANSYEAWLVGIDAAERGRGFGRAMIRALLATPTGRMTHILRCNHGSIGGRIAAKLFSECGFCRCRTTADQWWLVNQNTPRELVHAIATAPVVRIDTN